MENSKWIVRGASLAIVLGFFLPVALVSCGGYTEVDQTLSLANVADQLSKPILYLLPIAFIIVITLTFIKAKSAQEESNYLWGELAVGGISVLVTAVTLITLLSQFKQSSYGIFKVSPSFGFFVILAGIIAFAVGWTQQWQNMGRSVIGQPVRPPPIEYDHQESPRIAQNTVPILALISGNLPYRQVEIPYDKFTIGRSKGNALHLPDSAVSREHARIRLVQGMVFLQDQQSTGGTYVNGTRIDSIRLNYGDEVQIGPYKFRVEG